MGHQELGAQAMVGKLAGSRGFVQRYVGNRSVAREHACEFLTIESADQEIRIANDTMPLTRKINPTTTSILRPGVQFGR